MSISYALFCIADEESISSTVQNKGDAEFALQHPSLRSKK